jgi:L-seryl-tRNA(Ser) seleniumtransferase
MRSIPSIERLRQRPAMQDLETRYGRGAVVDALRAAAGALRHGASPAAPGADDDEVVAAIERDVEARLADRSRPSLRRVINATGVVIHTNLGRAPLAAVAVTRISALAPGYTNLEYDLDEGGRGRRDAHAEGLLCQLTGAEAAVVVNNNAAATMLVLAAMAAGREVVISRGELVEIGGGFRVPDVMAQSGAVLREVGTTNRTRAADYAAAIGDRTGLILRVHPSNFRIEGFTERPALGELTALGERFGIPVAEDVGSGYVEIDGDPAALAAEPAVAKSVAAGAAAVMFSGDKLLGGPQAGLIVGTGAAVARVRQHPLMRALRADKLTYAALEATLGEYLAGRAAATIPVRRMMQLTARSIGLRAASLVEALRGRGIPAHVEDGESAIGGGSAPGASLATRLVAVVHPTIGAAELEARLRAQDVPVIARIDNERVVLDLRTVDPDDDAALADAVGRTT